MKNSLHGGNENEGLINFNRGVGQNAYHLVWKLLRKHCEQFLREIAHKYYFEIYELEVMHDPVHLFAQITPTMNICETLQLFKGISSYKLFSQHSWLRNQFRKG